MIVVSQSHAPEKGQLVGQNNKGNNKLTLKTHLVNFLVHVSLRLMEIPRNDTTSTCSTNFPPKMT